MPAKKRALGRGLDALLGIEPSEDGTQTALAPPAIQSLPTSALIPNPYQPRAHFNSDSLDELAVSIREKGVLQPLIVRRSETGYEIVAGERRWRAAQRIGLLEVPVIVREYQNQDMLELALIENIQREELNPVEEARAYRQLIDEFNLTQEDVSERIGKSRVAVTNTLRLLRLPEKILAWIEEGQISAGHARALLSLESDQLRFALAREVMAKDLSVRETERRVRDLLKAPNTNVKAAEPVIEIATKDLEEKLRVHLGLQVRILPKTNTSGKVEVYYSSQDEFLRFFEHLGISLEQDI